jgi:hypothetical protein
MTPTPKPPAPPKDIPLWQKKLLKEIWDNAVKPRLDIAFKAAKTKLLAALAGQPLITIGTFVAAIDAFLLNGPKPRSGKSTKFLTDARKALGDVQAVIDRVLAPPKPISASLRKVLAGVVTMAGVLGIWTRVKPTVPAKTVAKP